MCAIYMLLVDVISSPTHPRLINLFGKGKQFAQSILFIQTRQPRVQFSTRVLRSARGFITLITTWAAESEIQLAHLLRKRYTLKMVLRPARTSVLRSKLPFFSPFSSRCMPSHHYFFFSHSQETQKKNKFSYSVLLFVCKESLLEKIESPHCDSFIILLQLFEK